MGKVDFVVFTTLIATVVFFLGWQALRDLGVVLGPVGLVEALKWFGVVFVAVAFWMWAGRK